MSVFVAKCERRIFTYFAQGDTVALYTKKLIMTTFQEMLAEMPFDKITVSALVKRAEGSPFLRKKGKLRKFSH